MQMADENADAVLGGYVKEQRKEDGKQIDPERLLFYHNLFPFMRNSLYPGNTPWSQELELLNKMALQAIFNDRRLLLTVVFARVYRFRSI